jgi:hypothetical protein
MNVVNFRGAHAPCRELQQYHGQQQQKARQQYGLQELVRRLAIAGHYQSGQDTQLKKTAELYNCGAEIKVTQE